MSMAFGSGYAGEGAKPLLRVKAYAKISMRSSSQIKTAKEITELFPKTILRYCALKGVKYW